MQYLCMAKPHCLYNTNPILLESKTDHRIWNSHLYFNVSSLFPVLPVCILSKWIQGLEGFWEHHSIPSMTWAGLHCARPASERSEHTHTHTHTHRASARLRGESVKTQSVGERLLDKRTVTVSTMTYCTLSLSLSVTHPTEMVLRLI